jgi:histidinol-phosphate phosphatase family protein
MTPPAATVYSVVIPTVGRPALGWLVAALAGGQGPQPAEVIVVDDRSDRRVPLPLPAVSLPLQVVAGAAAGPAAARNRGWRQATGEWVAFLDDDVVPAATWRADLAADLAAAGPEVAGSQGRIRVPLPAGRRPRDWERNVAGLEGAVWATADLAYRRRVLDEVGGFDERFPRAYREDTDLGLRVTGAGYQIVRGQRTVDHPVGPARAGVSVTRQRGNADDVLMAALHGAGWRDRAHAGAGRNRRHLATVGAAAVALAAAASRRRRPAVAASAAWAALTAELAARRLLPGPGDVAEVTAMILTSIAIPPAAVWHRLRGVAALPALLTDTGRAPLGVPRSPLAAASPLPPRGGWPDVAGAPAAPQAVLFDRDGTLVVDRPYNSDPAAVALMPGARLAVEHLRRAGVAVGVVTNQSGVARGLLSGADVAAVNGRVEELLGPFATWQVCPHGPEDGCGCRKPAPGLVKAAAGDLGVDPARCVVIGDIGTDVDAALAAGAWPILNTRRVEVAAAPWVAPSLLAAVDMVLARR